MIKRFIEKLNVMRICAVMHRCLRVLLTPFIFVGLILFGLISPIACIYWILTGVNILSMALKCQNRLIIFCWGGTGV